MKKILTMILALAMILSLAACTGEPAGTTGTTGTAEPTTPPTTRPTPVAEEVKGVTVPSFAIMINGVKVDNNMMAAYPLYSVVTNTVNSSGTASTTTYVGFAMTDVFKAAGLSENYIWLEATADDGYAISVSGDIVTAPTTLLAVTKNGEQFKTAPWFAPCGSGTTGDYLKNMVSILVNTTEERPDGFDNTLPDQPVTPPEGGDTNEAPELSDKTDKVTFKDFCFKVNGQEVTNETLKDLRIYKVSVNVTNKKGETSEVSYTGYKLIDVLAACGITDYTTVKVIANDGYETELTAEQMTSEYTLVAIEKDKETGEDGTIWLAPCLETSSGAYCKLVVEIVTG